MASRRSSESVGSQTSSRHTPVRVLKTQPPPDEWTKVKEVNMENRAPCEVRSQDLFSLKPRLEVSCVSDMEIWSQ